MKFDVLGYFLGVFILLVIILIIYVRKFLKSPTEAQIRMIKEWLLYCVIAVEKELGGGTGALKLRRAWSMFIEKFPALAPLVSFELFSLWVDEALDAMKHLLETNLDIKAYVEE